MRTPTPGRRRLFALLIVAASCGSPEAPGPSPAEVGTRQANWETQSSYDDTKSTHLWIVQNALLIVRDAGLVNGDSNAVTLLDKLLNSGVPCGQDLRKGLYDADYLAEYNDGVDTQQTGLGMTWDAFWKNGWRSHFYDPDTGENYAGESTPTALTQSTFWYKKSIDLATTSDGTIPPHMCYELGLALHYMTDLTQPMHAVNYTNKSVPFGRHSDYEEWVQNTITQPSLPRPAWFDMNAKSAPEIVTMAARWSKAHWVKPETGWEDDAAFVATTKQIVQQAAQHTANYILRWLRDASAAMAPIVFDDHLGLTWNSCGVRSSPCAAGEAIVGVFGRADTNPSFPGLSGLGFYCATIDPNGTLTAAHQSRVGYDDPQKNQCIATTGTPFSERCPAGYAVSGLRFQYDPDRLLLAALHSVAFTCSPVFNPNLPPVQSQWYGISFGVTVKSSCPAGSFLKDVRLGEFLFAQYADTSCAPIDPSLLADGRPRSCHDVKVLNPDATDGNQTIYVAGATPVNVICDDMAGTPREYLVLPSTASGVNQSTYPASLPWSPTGMTVKWQRVRFDPKALSVDVGDLTSTTQSGSRLVGTNKFGVAESCSSATLGTASVDLTGTPLAMVRGQFAPSGTAATGTAAFLPSGQFVHLTGGGNCGAMGPTSGKLLLLAGPTSCDQLFAWNPQAPGGDYQLLVNGFSVPSSCYHAPTTSATAMVSLRPFGVPDRLVAGSVDYIVGMVLTKVNTDYERMASSFIMVPGLSGAGTVSFASAASVSQPVAYLRQDHFKLFLNPPPVDETQVPAFNDDASFRVVPGLADASKASFRSLKYPDRVIRQRGYTLYLESGGDLAFNSDATFEIVPHVESGPFVGQGIQCADSGCISYGPGCNTTWVPGQCSFPRESALRLCYSHPTCVAVTCNVFRGDCQARDTTTMTPTSDASVFLLNKPVSPSSDGGSP